MRILIFLAALLLGACATQPTAQQIATDLSPAAATSASYGAATLSWGPLEDELAPAYTRNAMIRHRAARAVTRGEITRAQAIAVLRFTDEARESLDIARERRVHWRIERAHYAMDQAEEAMK